MGMATTSAVKRGKKKKGISPWKPNQHGAWAMLIVPAVVGTISGAVAAVQTPGNLDAAWIIPAILVAWFFGYFAFFAFGLAVKARNPSRRKAYLQPVYVYGVISLVGIIIALLSAPYLLWWALGFGPLIGIAVFETVRGRARSTISGVSTTIASALLLAVLTHVGAGSVSPEVWVATVFLALYFSGTIPYVKTMIREKGNSSYLRGSIIFHAVEVLLFLGVVLVYPPGLIGSALGFITLLIALYRAWAVPASAARGTQWTAKKVGQVEGPLVLFAAVAVLVMVL